MTRRTTSILSAVAVLGMALTTRPTMAHDRGNDDRNDRLSVLVAFGAGLNTAGAANQKVIPGLVVVDKGAVVTFAVAGTHQIFVYKPGKKAEDVDLTGGDATLINDLTDLYYNGLNPLVPAPANRSTAGNRVESVSFTEPGVYLVMCNIRGHFLNGMFGYVRVRGGDHDDDAHN